MSDFTVSDMTAQLSGTASDLSRKLPWWPLLVLSAAAFATVTVELLPASLLLELSDDLDVAESTAGLLVTAWALTIAAASIPLTRLTARVPRRHLLPLLVLLLALATAGTALAPSYGWALASRIVAASTHGVFWSLLVPTVATLVPPAVLGRAVSVVLAGPVLAGIVGIPLGAAIGEGVGWRLSFGLLAALLGAASAAVWSLSLQDAPRSVARQAGRDPAMRVVLAVAFATGLVLTGHFMLYTYIAPLLQQFGGYGAAARTALLLVFGLAGLLGIVVSGPLSDRFPHQALGWVSAAFAGSAASLALLPVNVAVAAVVIAAWGMLIGLLPPVFQTRLLRIASPGREAAVGAVGITVLNVGIAAGAAVGGLVVGTWNADGLPVVAAGVIGAAALGLLVYGARRDGVNG
ncbi:putative MFS family arabinose efflux permease [Micromonospora pisi]|uniref:Putative MFS family arabinose efflux permease n=2 Tax=Micromonospora pisi TaxID=589240 RepID=A0A495JVT1_9ACTN|nr:putative MFS family arabinose efflux permease [Micromonospora pisi]